MTPLTTPDDRRKGWRIGAALALIWLACVVMAALMAGCAPIELLAECAKRAAGCS